MVFVVSFIFLWLFQSLFLSSVTSPSVPVCLLFILLSLASCFILNIISSCGFPSILCFCFFTTPSCRVHFLFLCSPSACQITAVTPSSLSLTPRSGSFVPGFGLLVLCFGPPLSELLYTLHVCHCCHSIFYGVCSWAHT